MLPWLFDQFTNVWYFFFLLIYLTAAVVVRDPIPVIDELALALGGSIALFFILAKKDQKTIEPRLFQLQDKKSEFELKRYKQNKTLKNIFFKFREKNRSYSKYSDNELLEIANDPKHSNYPGMTNSSAIKGMNEIKLAGEEIEYSDFKLERIDDNINDTKQMINKAIVSWP